MGDPKRSRKKWAGPSHPWQGDRIKAEKEIKRKFGLKNKREIWKAQSKLKNFRGQARSLSAKLRAGNVQAEKETGWLLKKLVNLGILSEGGQLQNILALSVEDILNRRLESIVYMKGLTNTPKQARQFIIHGHIAIKDKRVTIPGYMVPKSEEAFITYSPRSPLTNELHPMRPKTIENREEIAPLKKEIDTEMFKK